MKLKIGIIIINLYLDHLNKHVIRYNHICFLFADKMVFYHHRYLINLL